MEREQSCKVDPSMSKDFAPWGVFEYHSVRLVDRVIGYLCDRQIRPLCLASQLHGAGPANWRCELVFGVNLGTLTEAVFDGLPASVYGDPFGVVAILPGRTIDQLRDTRFEHMFRWTSDHRNAVNVYERRPHLSVAQYVTSNADG